jgi:hypothetical protein
LCYLAVKQEGKKKEGEERKIENVGRVWQGTKKKVFVQQADDVRVERMAGEGDRGGGVSLSQTTSKLVLRVPLADLAATSGTLATGE